MTRHCEGVEWEDWQSDITPVTSVVIQTRRFPHSVRREMTSITEPPGQIPTDLVWWRTKLYSKSRKKSRKRCWKCLLFPWSDFRLDVVCISVCNKLFLRDIGLGFQGPGAPDQEAGPGLVINLFSLKNPDALNDRLGITP